MRKLLLLLFPLLLLTACKDESSPTGTNSTTKTQFVYNVNRYDGGDKLIGQDSRTIVLTRENMTFAGKSGVRMYVSTDASTPNERDTNYFVEEANGDLSVLSCDAGL
jgi:hypothetical protein